MNLRPHSFLWIFLLACLVPGGCVEDDRPPANIDLSAPAPVAIAFLQAIQWADSRTAKTLSVGSPEQKQWIESRTVLVGGMRGFDNALYTQFGRITNQVHVDMGEALRDIADGPVELIRTGQVSVNDNDARIDPKRNGFWSRHQQPIYLLRDKDGWRVDLAKSYASDASPAAVTENFRQERKVGESFAAVARDVSAGKFKSVDEANQSLADRLRAAFKAQ